MQIYYLKVSPFGFLFNEVYNFHFPHQLIFLVSFDNSLSPVISIRPALIADNCYLWILQ